MNPVHHSPYSLNFVFCSFLFYFPIEKREDRKARGGEEKMTEAVSGITEDGFKKYFE